MIGLGRLPGVEEGIAAGEIHGVEVSVEKELEREEDERTGQILIFSIFSSAVCIRKTKCFQFSHVVV